MKDVIISFLFSGQVSMPIAHNCCHIAALPLSGIICYMHISTRHIFLLSVAPEAPSSVTQETPAESIVSDQPESKSNDDGEAKPTSDLTPNETVNPGMKTHSNTTSKESKECDTAFSNTSVTEAKSSTRSTSNRASNKVKSETSSAESATVMTGNVSCEQSEKSDEKVEGQKPEGDSEQLEVLVDDTQNDLDADLLNSQSSAKPEASVGEASVKTDADTKDAGDGDGLKKEDSETVKTEAAKSTEGETKSEDKKPDDKRLVGFV